MIGVINKINFFTVVFLTSILGYSFPFSVKVNNENSVSSVFLSTYKEFVFNSDEKIYLLEEQEKNSITYSGYAFSLKDRCQYFYVTCSLNARCDLLFSLENTVFKLKDRGKYIKYLIEDKQNNYCYKSWLAGISH
jgi:hypothetical protein